MDSESGKPDKKLINNISPEVKRRLILMLNTAIIACTSWILADVYSIINKAGAPAYGSFLLLLFLTLIRVAVGLL